MEAKLVCSYLCDGCDFAGIWKADYDIEEWLYKKDFVAGIRVARACAFAAAMNSLKYIGRNYDYSFSHDNEQVYCSELSCRTEWPEFLSEFQGDEILPQLYLDYSKPWDCSIFGACD
jgi:hypothetical protein